jgi:hypothetical protein
VRRSKTHDKEGSLPCVSKQRTSKTNGRLLQGWRKKKKLFAVRRKMRRMAKKLFAVRPIKDARQGFELTAKAAFPVVKVCLSDCELTVVRYPLLLSSLHI